MQVSQTGIFPRKKAYDGKGNKSCDHRTGKQGNNIAADKIDQIGHADILSSKALPHSQSKFLEPMMTHSHAQHATARCSRPCETRSSRISRRWLNVLPLLADMLAPRRRWLGRGR